MVGTKVRSPSSSPKWRPIKSAPKDGTMVLLAEPIGNGAEGFNVWWGRWVDVPQEDKRGLTTADPEHDPMWVASYAAIYTDGETSMWHLKPVIIFRPTQWMPVPQPPSKRTLKRSRT